MRRISSLPSLEFCGRSDQIAKGVNTSNAFRSTCFHKYCESGEWPAEVSKLSEQDFTEVKRWKKPGRLRLEKFSGRILTYEESKKEVLVALDRDFNYIDLPNELSQDELDKRDDVFVAGHLDMAWYLPELSLVVVSDIKSSIFAVKDRAESLQLHGYGVAYAKKCGAGRYITSIWDASDGKYFLSERVVEFNSFEGLEVQERIRLAAVNPSDSYTKGTHCSGCWKRDSCPAHLVDLGSENRFQKLFSADCTESDVREALIQIKGFGGLLEKASDRCKDWVSQHGPIRDETGKKEWAAQLRPGRKSLNQDAVAKDLGLTNLDKYMKKGEDYRAYDWRNVKE